jgi:predicted TIM-barrel fold metal-dependent hydrolase
MQVFANLPLLGACSELLAGLAVPLVFDHYAGAQAALGAAQPGLPEVLELIESGKAYVKLSAPYRCADPGALESLAPLTRLLMQRNPERMLWGSDWPHPQPGVRAMPTEICPPFDVPLGRVLGAMCAWAPNADTLQKMFVDNPERLYGFGHQASRQGAQGSAINRNEGNA